MLEVGQIHNKVFGSNDRLEGEKVFLRLVSLGDCTARYVAWLADSEVNRFLETRWTIQDAAAIRDFVSKMTEDPNNYLFAIVERKDRLHIGNIKVGPVNRWHRFADISYFVGDRSYWGKGLATEAIRLATQFAFDKLDLRRVQAGVYETNTASVRALQNAGYEYECRFSRQLRDGDRWVDHLWYSKVRPAA